MRAVLQRVRSGAVRVDGEIVGAIDHGFVILVGVGHGDGEAQAQWLARKIAGLRVFEDADGKPTAAALARRRLPGRLAVHALRRRAQGPPPQLHRRRPAGVAEPLIARFADMLRQAGVQRVAMGVFESGMQRRPGDDLAGHRRAASGRGQERPVIGA